jgi:hypothetical protein
MIALADGSVRPVADSTAPAVLTAIFTRHGGEQVPGNW